MLHKKRTISLFYILPTMISLDDTFLLKKSRGLNQTHSLEESHFQITSFDDIFKLNLDTNYNNLEYVEIVKRLSRVIRIVKDVICKGDVSNRKSVVPKEQSDSYNCNDDQDEETSIKRIEEKTMQIELSHGIVSTTGHAHKGFLLCGMCVCLLKALFDLTKAQPKFCYSKNTPNLLSHVINMCQETNDLTSIQNAFIIPECVSNFVSRISSSFIYCSLPYICPTPNLPDTVSIHNVPPPFIAAFLSLASDLALKRYSLKYIAKQNFFNVYNIVYSSDLITSSNTNFDTPKWKNGSSLTLSALAFLIDYVPLSKSYFLGTDTPYNLPTYSDVIILIKNCINVLLFNFDYSYKLFALRLSKSFINNISPTTLLSLDIDTSLFNNMSNLTSLLSEPDILSESLNSLLALASSTKLVSPYKHNSILLSILSRTLFPNMNFAIHLYPKSHIILLRNLRAAMSQLMFTSVLHSNSIVTCASNAISHSNDPDILLTALDILLSFLTFCWPRADRKSVV